MVIMIHSYIFDLQYRFSHAALIQGKKIGHRHSISNIGSQKYPRTLPGHTWYWLRPWHGNSCFLGNSLSMKKILILIIKSQWKIYSSGRCLIESGPLKKCSDIISPQQKLTRSVVMQGWLLFTQPCLCSKAVYFFRPSS